MIFGYIDIKSYSLYKACKSFASNYKEKSHCVVVNMLDCPVGWGRRIHGLFLCRGVRPPSNECPGYDTKQSDGEIPAMLELWGMRGTPSLPLLPGPLLSGMVAPDKGPIYGLNITKPCFFHYTDFCI